MGARRRVVAVGLAALAAWVAMPGVAESVAFDPSPPAISPFTPITLNGTQQLASLTVDPFAVTDLPGGAGWHVLLTLPNLVNGASTILASTITMTAPNVTASPPYDITGVVGHAATGGFAAGEKIVTASVGNGVGTFLVSPQPVMVVVPPDARAGTYVSASTIQAVSGP